MATLKIRTPKVFLPLLQPAPYKGAWGGRGSAKSHTMAENLVERCLMVRGTDWVCLREYQASIEQSSKKLIEEKIETLGVGSYFRVYNKVIQTPGDGHIIFEGLQDHTADSIKSLQGFHGSWVEEAQSISATSLQILRPTLRAEGAERWFSWNPRRATDAVDKLLRGPLIPTGAIVVKANWSDNPFFPAELERERLDCLRNEPEQYEHIWEGGYATVLDGAYYARYILEAKESGRIGRVPPAPLITYRAFCDLGGTGARSDAFTIWIAQFVGKEVRVLNYYEVVGQPVEAHIDWLRREKYTPENTTIVQPHDGETQDRLHDVSFASAFRQAGYDVEVIKNQGRGAARARIEAARLLFPSMWFNEATTAPGLAALGWYHEKKDDHRGLGLGPKHDWSSHAADSFGLMAIAYEEPRTKPRKRGDYVVSWMN